MSRQQGPNLREDYSREGLPQAEDYDPDALGTVQYRAGEPVQQWPEFGLELVPVEMRSKTQESWTDTGRRHVARNGKFISDVSADYKLLPNERLVGVANEVARELDAEPFHEFEGDWFARLDDHVFQDEERRRVHAVYAWQPGEIGGDDLEYGFAVHNSIDGSLGFSVGLFSFRHACANMVFLGTASREAAFALNVEDEREIISSTSHKHTAGLDIDPEALKATIKGTILLIDGVHDSYQEWVDQRLTPEDVLGLIERPNLAQSDLPIWITGGEDDGDDGLLDALDAAAANESLESPDDLPRERKAEIVEAEMPEVSRWDTYNNLTQAIWHAGESSDNTRRRKMKDVHRVLTPTASARGQDFRLL